MSQNPCIVITEVTKIFKTGFLKNKIAVDSLSLEVAPGEVVGLLGPNGSGKSTTMKMILGFLKPTRGEILICGESTENQKARTFIGYLPENPRFQKFLSGRDILSYYGKLLGLVGNELIKKIEFLLDLVNLKHAANERVQGYSKGMSQRLAIAQALLNNPALLIFDEPMSGLDPLGRMEVRNIISTIHTENPATTIFFSSHVLEDVETLCKSVALLQKGKLKTYGSIESIVSSVEPKYDIVIQNLPEDLESQLFFDCPSRQLAIGKSFSVTGPEHLSRVLSKIVSSPAKILGINSQRKNLEESLFKANDNTQSLETSL